jgi:hypothetical protein
MHTDMCVHSVDIIFGVIITRCVCTRCVCSHDVHVKYVDIYVAILNWYVCVCGLRVTGYYMPLYKNGFLHASKGYKR